MEAAEICKKVEDEINSKILENGNKIKVLQKLRETGAFGKIFIAEWRNPENNRTEELIVKSINDSIRSLLEYEKKVIKVFYNEAKMQMRLNNHLKEENSKTSMVKAYISDIKMTVDYISPQNMTDRNFYIIMKREHFTLDLLLHKIQRKEGTLDREIDNFIEYLKGADFFEVSNMIVEFLWTVYQMHNLGYVHRDIKPDNIFFRRDDKDTHNEKSVYHIVLGDFGMIAPVKLVKYTSKSQLGEMFDTCRVAHSFCAPELAYDFGYPSAYFTSDVFSVACIIYTFLWICINVKLQNSKKNTQCYLSYTVAEYSNYCSENKIDARALIPISIFASYDSPLPFFYFNQPKSGNFIELLEILGIDPFNIYNGFKKKNTNIQVNMIKDVINNLDDLQNAFDISESSLQNIKSFLQKATDLDPNKRFCAVNEAGKCNAKEMFMEWSINIQPLHD